MVGGDHCLFFWMEQRPSGVPIAIKNNVKLIECRIVHFASLKSSTCFEKIKKLDSITRNGKFYHLFGPLKYHVTLLPSHQFLGALRNGGYRE